MIRAEYIDHMGTDLSVVNAARVSFGAESAWLPSGAPSDYPGVVYQNINGRPVNLTKGDAGLIKFLARGCPSGKWEEALEYLATAAVEPEDYEAILKWAKNLPTHWTPFAQTAIKLREFVPVPIARQRFKHKIGFVENEISRRYVDATPTMFYPDGWRKAAPNVKQGSSDEFLNDILVNAAYDTRMRECVATYEMMIERGVCPEQARFVLPQAMMVEYVTTGNLYSFAEAYIKRSDAHAQKEIRDLAAHWDRIIRPLFPVSWSALVD